MKMRNAASRMNRAKSTCAVLALLLGAVAIADETSTQRIPFLDRSVQIGARVSVKGRMLPSGILEADEVELERSRSDDQELRGPISDLDLEGRTFRLLGRTVRLRSKTSYTFEPDRPATAADLRNGLWVEVEGDPDDQGRLKAEEIQIRRDQREGARVKLEGLITAVESSTEGLAQLRIADVPVVLTVVTELVGLRGGSRPIVRRLGVVDDDDDLQFTRNTRLGKHVVMAGEVRLKGEYLDNPDLEDPTGDAPDDTEFVPEIAAQLGFAARWGPIYGYGSVVGTKEFFIRSEDAFEEGASKIRVAEAYFSVPLARGVGLALGRQRFSDERDWHYSTNNLDAARVLAEFYPFAFEASFSSDVFDEHRNQRDRELNNVILRGTYRAFRDTDLELYYIDRNDRTELDDSPRTLGLRLIGDPGRRFEFWLDLAHQTGTYCSRVAAAEGTLFDTGRQCNRNESEGQFNVRDVRAQALDLGVIYRPRIKLDPTFTVGYAWASGEDDEIRNLPVDEAAQKTSTSFRQTGLHGNRWKFNGVVSFRYYGEAMDPELTNIRVLTLGAGLRPNRGLSIDLIYHDYRQDEASKSFHEFEIDETPNGVDRELGREWDLAFGFEPRRFFEIRLTGGWFLPGKALGADAGNSAAARFQAKFRF